PPTAADRSRLTDPDAVLPAGWQRAADRAVTTIGERDGLHILVAEESTAYQWRTAATLTEPGFDTDRWIGQSCMTGSGRYAAVVYAPRVFANRAGAVNAGGFVAIVDLAGGTVTKLAQRASLAYYNPGCGGGDEVALSTLRDGATTTTTVAVVDARTGAVTREITTGG